MLMVVGCIFTYSFAKIKKYNVLAWIGLHIILEAVLGCLVGLILRLIAGENFLEIYISISIMLEVVVIGLDYMMINKISELKVDEKSIIGKLKGILCKEFTFANLQGASKRTSNNKVNEIANLKKLFDDGKITKEEYDQRRMEIIRK